MVPLGSFNPPKITNLRPKVANFGRFWHFLVMISGGLKGSKDYPPNFSPHLHIFSTDLGHLGVFWPHIAFLNAKAIVLGTLYENIFAQQFEMLCVPVWWASDWSWLKAETQINKGPLMCGGYFRIYPRQKISQKWMLRLPKWCLYFSTCTILILHLGKQFHSSVWEHCYKYIWHHFLGNIRKKT